MISEKIEKIQNLLTTIQNDFKGGQNFSALAQMKELNSLRIELTEELLMERKRELLQ